VNEFEARGDIDVLRGVRLGEKLSTNIGANNRMPNPKVPNASALGDPPCVWLIRGVS